MKRIPVIALMAALVCMMAACAAQNQNTLLTAVRQKPQLIEFYSPM